MNVTIYGCYTSPPPKMVIMDFCTIIQYPVTVFFQAKKIQVAVCLVVWWFSGFGLFQVFFYRSIGPMAPFFGNPGNQMHSTSKNTVFAETARVCTGHGTLDIQALQYLLRWVGVLGCMSFFGSKYWTSGAVWMSRVLNRILFAKRSSKTTLDAERNFGSPLLKAA